MKYETREDFVEYKGHRRAFESTGWWCTACNEAIFEGPELQKAEQAFVGLRAEVESVLLPKQIAAIRKKLHLSQREAGKVLGGGPRAFQKYEAGSVPVSAPMNNLLLLLGNDPNRLEELRRQTKTVEDPTRGRRKRSYG
jgi:HTH-type transcriptional regulator/antitoxin MqsA